MLNNDALDILRKTLDTLIEFEVKERRVRTPAGQRRFKQPIGSIIFDKPNADVVPNVSRNDKQSMRKIFEKARTTQDAIGHYAFFDIDEAVDDLVKNYDSGDLGLSEKEFAIYLQALENRDARVATHKYSPVNPVQRKKALSFIAEMRKSGRVAVSMDADSAMKVISSGRIKSQFETGSSKGFYLPDHRAKMESSMFDYHPGLDPTLRPIYGYIATTDIAHGNEMLANYGLIKFVMKKSVHGNTTFTFGDSLDSELLPSGMTWEPDGDVDILATEPVYGIYEDNLKSHQQNGYIEAQIHGGASIEEIDYVLVPNEMVGDESWKKDGNKKIKKFIEMARKAGIKIRRYDAVDGYDV